jgi:hypothetical protein
MNRHTRRMIAAQQRRVRTGYLHRLNAVQPLLQGGSVYHAMVQHDAGCRIYIDGQCDCVPEISIHHGSDVIMVEPDGQTRKVAVS